MRPADPVALLHELVAVPSPSGEEAELAALVLATAREWKLDAEMMGRNAVLRVGSSSRPRLLLNSHLDTVAPAADWPHDPFVPHEHEGRISGLGANDAKGCVAAMMAAVARQAEGSLPGEVVLALTVDEEVGSDQGLAGVVAQLGPLDAAVIGEPTGLDICCAQKGLLILELQTTGIARHAAHADRLPGANAVVEASRAILELEGLHPGPEHPLLGRATCHVTTISGGTRRNVIPDRCVFCLDIRTVDEHATAEIIDLVRARSGAEVRVLSDRFRPFSTDPESHLVAAARRALPAARVVGSATVSDAVWTRHLPTIKIGPGQSERSHTVGEYVTRSELEDGVAFYHRLVTEFFTMDGRSS